MDVICPLGYFPMSTKRTLENLRKKEKDTIMTENRKTERYKEIESEFLYKNYLGIKRRITEMLADDYFDVDRVKFMLWYLDEERHKLDELKVHKYMEQLEKKEGEI